MDESISQLAISRITLKTERLFEKLAEPVDALPLSNKMQILMNILLFAEAVHDKVLVFSHRISTLDYIDKQLAKAAKPYARIDGLQNPNKRQQITKEFNEGNVNVCLISTRAGEQASICSVQIVSSSWTITLTQCGSNKLLEEPIALDSKSQSSYIASPLLVRLSRLSKIKPFSKSTLPPGWWTRRINTKCPQGCRRIPVSTKAGRARRP